jgi:(p)ppGpp synthase/HD superfamily hydrolase
MNISQLVLAIATKAHSGQVDKAGQPYIDHPIAVAESVRHLGETHYAAALLHDVIEDTGYDAKYLLATGVPSNVVEAVEVLTHRKGESRIDYYQRVRQHPVALAVKLADVAHNAGEQRLAALSQEDSKRLRNKYAEARMILLEEERE